jgi:tRNA modification GTPase
MDLTQAEAVAQIVSGSNTAQIQAAEKLLAGHLAETVGQIRNALLDWLSRLEAGLDFAEEDIEILPRGQAARILLTLRSQINELLTGPVQYERMIDLPSVGIAGPVNAGKSMLLNALLGRPRSIVSDARAATRDILCEILPLKDIDCVLFDCAGLSTQPPLDPLDALAQQAAQSALRKADLILFCIDISKTNLSEEHGLWTLFASKPLIPLATQSDRLAPADIGTRLEQLKTEFGRDFIPISALRGHGLETLKQQIRNALLAIRNTAPETDTALMLNQRHRQILSETAAALTEAVRHVEQGRDEIAAMLVRSAWEQLGGFERENLSEALLEQIFSRFCIGK